MSLKRMVLMLRDALKERGLQLHPTKCKAQTNRTDWTRRGNVELTEGFSLHILPEGESLEVLGTMLPLEDVTPVEIQHRVAMGWRKFWAMQKMLLNKDVSLPCRLKLFDTSVGACVLYGSNSWTPRAAEIRILMVAQNMMLRRICGFRRAPKE